MLPKNLYIPLFQLFTMIKNKKGQGLSLTTIIVAVLVLIVLVVIIMIFTGRMGTFGKSLNNCDGECSQTARCNEGSMPIPISNCKELGEEYKYCCIATTTY